MKILVMGAGALGCYFGARLAVQGHELTYVARGAHLEALRTNGLTVESHLGDLRFESVNAIADPAEAETPDLVLFMVKTPDVETAARALLPVLGPDTLILTSQNGVSAQPRLAAAVGQAKVLPGAVYMPADIKSPGVIRHAVPFHRIVFGEWDGPKTPRAQAIADAIAATGIDVTLSDDVWRVLWEKFIMQSANAAMTTLIRLDIGQIRAVPMTRDLLRRAIEETAAIGRIEHPSVPEDAAETAFNFLMNVTPTMHASMLDDLRRGKPLELNDISGEVVRRGQRLGIPTPVHEIVTAALQPYANGAPA